MILLYILPKLVHFSLSKWNSILQKENHSSFSQINYGNVLFIKTIKFRQMK